MTNAVNDAIDKIRTKLQNAIDKMVKFIRDKLGINKDNNQGQQGSSGDQGQQNSGTVIPKDASTEVVTASPSNILVADKSRGFNQA